MRWVLGPPPDSLSADDLASGEWTRLRQPPLWLAQLLAVPVGLAVAVVVFVGWVALTPRFPVEFEDSPWVYVIIVANLLLVPLLQIAAHPPDGFFRQSVLGFWASRLTLYSASLATCSKHRFLEVLTLPFLLAALGPLLFVAETGMQSGWLVFSSCIAAVVSGWPLTQALVAAFQVPGRAQVGRVGFQIYWRR